MWITTPLNFIHVWPRISKCSQQIENKAQTKSMLETCICMQSSVNRQILNKPDINKIFRQALSVSTSPHPLVKKLKKWISIFPKCHIFPSLQHFRQRYSKSTNKARDTYLMDNKWVKAHENQQHSLTELKMMERSLG